MLAFILVLISLANVQEAQKIVDNDQKLFYRRHNTSQLHDKKTSMNIV